MRVCVILNPYADRGRAASLQTNIVKWAEPHGLVDVLLTDAPGRATILAQEAIASGYEAIVAAGGDGTVHEVVNGLMATARPDIPLGIVPIGSGNDYAFGLGLLTDPETALRRVFVGAARPVDLAHIADNNGRERYVVNGVGIGFDATVTIESEKITFFKGELLYLIATFRTLLFRYHSPHFRLTFDEEVVTQRALMLALGLGPRVGGGFYLTPEAQFDDGLLDSCLVNPVNRLTILSLLPSVMKGTHVTSKHVTMRRNRAVHLEADTPLAVHLDGEIFAAPEDGVTQLTVTTIPQAVNIIT